MCCVFHVCFFFFLACVCLLFDLHVYVVGDDGVYSGLCTPQRIILHTCIHTIHRRHPSPPPTTYTNTTLSHTGMMHATSFR